MFIFCLNINKRQKSTYFCPMAKRSNHAFFCAITIEKIIVFFPPFFEETNKVAPVLRTRWSESSLLQVWPKFSWKFQRELQQSACGRRGSWEGQNSAPCSRWEIRTILPPNHYQTAVGNQMQVGSRAMLDTHTHINTAQ